MFARTFVLTICVAAACASDQDKAAPEPAPEPAKPAPAKPAPAVSADVITFQVPSPQVGDKHVESAAMTMDVTTTDDQGTHQRKVESKLVKHEEVLAVSNGRMTKVEIRYEVAETTQTVDGKATAVAAPHAGKTYLVDIAPDRLTIKTPGGKAPFANEIKSVTEDQASLLSQYGLERILASKAFRIGEPVVFTADDLEVLNRAMGDQQATAMTFTLRAADAKTATFDVTTVVEEPLMKVELAGTAVFDRATLDSLDLAQAGKVSGTVTGTITMQTSYAPPGGP